MNIGTFFLCLSLVVITCYLSFAWISQGVVSSNRALISERAFASIVVVVILTVALSWRPFEFGVDTITYYSIFKQYCLSNVQDMESSYWVTFGVLNSLSFGACDPNTLLATWVAGVLISFILLPDETADKIKIAALAFFSVIGIELMSNALRQGISAAVMMLALAWFQKNKLAGSLIAIFGVVLHQSSALVLLALVIAHMPWRFYLIAFAMIAGVILSYSAIGIDIPMLDRLTYEINKYWAHDSVELYVRVIAGLQLAVPILVLLITRQPDGNKSGRYSRETVIALRVALTALPYLTLPYFGYRYIYGIYLVVLYLCRRPLLSDQKSGFEIVMIANVILALAWAFGSSYVREIPFFVFS